jgi:NAD+ synthase
MSNAACVRLPVQIEGKDSISVDISAAANPQKILYAWADNPQDRQLYNSEGLPAIPFRIELLFNAVRVKDEIIRWIRGYFEENGKGCAAVVGISGGKDSSITAALCAQALGPDRVYGVLMPQGVQYDIEVSRNLATHLGIPCREVNIKGGADALFSAIGESGTEVNRQAAVNTPARLRMAVLYAVSAAVNGRVANTCNLSEDWVGYSTKYGDSAGDFSPLAELTVTEVKQIGRELGLPSQFIDKVPEDGLSGFTDEENLGFTYSVLDRYIREGFCENAAIREKIDRLHRTNLHKLKPMPRYQSIEVSEY